MIARRKPRRGYSYRLKRIAQIIETVFIRSMACDGPDSPFREEMTDAEMLEIYQLAVGKKSKNSGVNAGTIKSA